jgi:hypothetical protein
MEEPLMPKLLVFVSLEDEEITIVEVNAETFKSVSDLLQPVIEMYAQSTLNSVQEVGHHIINYIIICNP